MTTEPSAADVAAADEIVSVFMPQLTRDYAPSVARIIAAHRPPDVEIVQSQQAKLNELKLYILNIQLMESSARNRLGLEHGHFCGGSPCICGLNEVRRAISLAVSAIEMMQP